MDDKTQQILERVAEGVWCQQSNDLFSWSQCAFCFTGPHSEHDKDCPVRIARDILN